MKLLIEAAQPLSTLLGDRMWLLIDDVRDLNVDVIARNPDAAYKMLSLGGWECILFDNDLGTEIEGYQILDWALERNLIPDHVQLVTSNTVALARMQSALTTAGYTTKNGRIFFKHNQQE